MDDSNVRKFLESQDSFWLWDNHKHVAQLTSGKLSDFFANCTPIYADPRVQAAFAEELAGLVSNELNDFAGKSPNIWVVGSAMGAVGLAQDIAAVEGFRAAYTEPAKVQPDEDDIMSGNDVPRKIMQLKRFDLGEAPHIILCEDVVTTGGTTLLTIDGIRKKHSDAVFFPSILTLVNRNPGVAIHPNEDLEGLEVRALYEHKTKVWDTVDKLPEEMKDCIPLRPKGNWDKLKEKRQ